MRYVPAILMAGCLSLAGCLTETTQATPLTPEGYAVIPVIDYPDVYINRYGFGFDLADGWTADWRDDQNTLILRKDCYALWIGYRFDTQPLPPSREPLPTDRVDEAGSLTLDSFWEGEIVVPKYRLTEDNRVTRVYYGDEIAIGSRRLAIVLYEEPTADASPQGIPAAIESEADAILQSYEEHGWEE